jgi:hypothetical protein
MIDLIVSYAFDMLSLFTSNGNFEIGCANQTTNVDSNLNFSLARMLTNIIKCLQLNNLFCEEKMAK